MPSFQFSGIGRGADFSLTEASLEGRSSPTVKGDDSEQSDEDIDNIASDNETPVTFGDIQDSRDCDESDSDNEPNKDEVDTVTSKGAVTGCAIYGGNITRYRARTIQQKRRHIAPEDLEESHDEDPTKCNVL
jgi:hypothetical protein